MEREKQKRRKAEDKRQRKLQRKADQANGITAEDTEASEEDVDTDEDGDPPTGENAEAEQPKE